MPILQSLANKTILFQEEREKLSCKDSRFNSLLEAGYVLIGKHSTAENYLFRRGQEFLLLAFDSLNNTPPAIGIIVDDIESVLAEAQNENVDIFDGGRIGGLSLHIPAFRNTEGSFVYLIDKNRKEDFYALDFMAVESAHA